MAVVADTQESAHGGLNRPPGPRSKPPLRVALFLDGPMQPGWMVEAFVRIARADFAVIVLIATSPRPQPRMPWLWRAWRNVDRLVFRTVPDPSDLADMRSAIPTARYATLPAASEPAWAETVGRGQHLDVAFVIGAMADAEFENIARYGVWRFFFGAEYGSREDLAGWREVSEGAPVTASGLRVHLRPGDDRLLCGSRSRTYPLSVLKNRANLLRKTALFAERELRMLYLSGSALLKDSTPLPAQAANRSDTPPNNGEILRALPKIGGRIVRRGLQKLGGVEQWFIAYRFGAPAWDGDMDKFTRLLPPKDRFWADPFPLCRDGRYFLFFEELVFASGKGHIAMIEIYRDGGHSEPIKILERSYHLSYPFLIEQDGELFMVPESSQNRSIELYRCIRFPDLWRLEKVLLRDVAGVDATFHRADRGWWMFVTIGGEGTEPYDELHLFHADDLLGEWQPHRANPVKSDVCGGRPAGRLFVHGGVLHRPAQICAPLYGSGITIAAVRRLSPQTYQEQEVARILPSRAQGILGIHTLNHSGDLHVIDGFIRRSRF